MRTGRIFSSLFDSTGQPIIIHDYNEAFYRCVLYPGRMRQFECTDEYLAAIAGTHPSADMAWGCAGCAADPGAGIYDSEQEPGCRQAVGGRGKCFAAHREGVFTKGNEYGRGGRRVSGRRLQHVGHRS